MRHAEFQGRVEDDRLTTGRGRYVADIRVDGLLHVAIVRSPHAHARIRGIDAESARVAPGVVAVLTAAELAADGIGDLPCGVELTRPDGSKAFQARRQVLARERVRYVGEAVAAVVAQTPASAVDAADLVMVEYDELPAVPSAAAARKPGAATVWDEVRDNIAFVWKKGDPDKVAAALGTAARVVRLRSQISRVTAASLEPRGVLAMFEGDGKLTVHTSNQSPHGLKAALAAQLKLAAEKVRIVAGDVGGSFGMKAGLFPEDVIVPWAARRLGRPVRWIGERRESFLADDQGRDVAMDGELGLDADGRIVGLRVSFDINVGCYLSTRSMGLLNNIGGIAGVYRIPAIAAEVTGVFSNTQPTAPYRGAGRPEATYAIERLMDLAAQEAGIDPFELRRRNLIPAEAMPYDTGFMFKYDCGEFEENMLAAARIADLAGFTARRKEAAGRGKLRGLGISNPIEVAAGPFSKPGKDLAWLRVEADGSVLAYAGIMSVGQGLETAMTHLIADRLALPLEKVRYVQGDTDNLPAGRGSGGSSGLAVGGSAVTAVLDKMIASGRAIAADLLEAKAEDVGFEDGRFPLKGTNRSVGLAEVAKLAKVKRPEGLAESAEFQPQNVTYPNGCHICELEIDPDTGAIDIQRYTVAEDVGNVLFPELVRGQMHGGIAMGIGQAIGERIVHDPESGQLLSASFMDYLMPHADEVPRIAIETRAVPTKVNPLGVKGVGEAGTVGSLAATINAVCHALAPLGITHIEMPASPERVWLAIQATKKKG